MVLHSIRQYVRAFLELPLLLLPIAALFLPQLRRSTGRTRKVVVCVGLLYLVLAVLWRHSHPDYLLEPTGANILGVHGYVEAHGVQGNGPILLGTWPRAVLTVLSIGGMLGLFASLGTAGRSAVAAPVATAFSWRQLQWLLLPFTAAYGLILIPRSTSELYDRYLLALLVVAIILAVRYYQEHVGERVPASGFVLAAIASSYGICCVHNTFGMARSVVAMEHRMRDAGVPQSDVELGWDHDGLVELENFGYIDNTRIAVPAGVYVPIAPTVDPACFIPPIPYRFSRPRYGISFNPNICLGKAEFAPATYRTWPTGELTSLYMVKLTPISKR